jgi:hypothetical protein
MNCPKCQARIPAEDINVQALIAKCPQCGEVFCVEEELGESDSLSKHKEIKKPKPANVVNMLLAEERSVKLLKGLPDKQMALFIEQQLEEWLKIKPRHVKGAIS